MVVLSYNRAGKRFFAGWTVSVFGYMYDANNYPRIKFTSDLKEAIAFVDKASAQRFLRTCPNLSEPLGITEVE